MRKFIQVSASEALATDRRIRAEKAESTVEELQLRLTAQVAQTESTQEQLQRIFKYDGNSNCNLEHLRT